MSFYSCPFSGVVIGKNDVPKTIAALTVPNTAGNRCRIVSVNLSISTSPIDDAIKVALKRVAAAGAKGTGTTLTPVPKKDTGAVDSIITCKTNYSPEPTYASANPVWSSAMNDRGGIIKEWDNPGEMPIALQDEALGLLIWLLANPGTAPDVNGTIEFEVW